MWLEYILKPFHNQMVTINLWAAQVNKVNVILNRHVYDIGVKRPSYSEWMAKEKRDNGWGMGVLVSYGTISGDNLILQQRILDFSSD